MVILFLILIAITVSVFLTSTFDISVSVYKTKNRTLEYISLYQDPLYIQSITYNYNNTNLDMFVSLNKTPNNLCPDQNYFEEKYNYGSLKDYLQTNTKFDTVTITLYCN